MIPKKTQENVILWWKKLCPISINVFKDDLVSYPVQAEGLGKLD